MAQFHPEAVVIAAQVPEGSVRDAKDRAILACAVGGRANYIVAGDQDLLVPGAYEDTPIVSPTHFITILNRAEHRP